MKIDSILQYGDKKSPRQLRGQDTQIHKTHTLSVKAKYLMK